MGLKGGAFGFSLKAELGQIWGWLGGFLMAEFKSDNTHIKVGIQVHDTWKQGTHCIENGTDPLEIRIVKLFLEFKNKLQLPDLAS